MVTSFNFSINCSLSLPSPFPIYIVSIHLSLSFFPSPPPSLFLTPSTTFPVDTGILLAVIALALLVFFVILFTFVLIMLTVHFNKKREFKTRICVHMQASMCILSSRLVCKSKCPCWSLWIKIPLPFVRADSLQGTYSHCCDNSRS